MTTLGAAALAPDTCAAVDTAALGLPHTMITVAAEITGTFTPPETFSSRGSVVEGLSFCRVAGIAPSRGPVPYVCVSAAGPLHGDGKH